MRYRRQTTTVKTGRIFRSIAGKVSQSPKKSKPAGRVFGTSSQFRGGGHAALRNIAA